MKISINTAKDIIDILKKESYDPSTYFHKADGLNCMKDGIVDRLNENVNSAMVIRCLNGEEVYIDIYLSEAKIISELILKNKGWALNE